MSNIIVYKVEAQCTNKDKVAYNAKFYIMSEDAKMAEKFANSQLAEKGWIPLVVNIKAIIVWNFKLN